MDPSAMDFVMHRSPPAPNRSGLSPMALDHQHSPCPALRAAAEQNQLPGLHSHPRGSNGSHYDPVHSSIAGGNWWHPPPHDGWQHPPYTPPHMLSRQMPMYTHAPPFPPPPGLIPPTGVSQANAQPMPPFGIGGMLGDYYSAHGHPHAYAQPPARFSHRPTIPSLDRVGGTAPNPLNYHNSFGNSASSSGSAEQASRAIRLPALAHISSNSTATTSTTDLASPTRTFPDGESSRTPERQAATRQSSSTVTMPPMPSRAAESGNGVTRVVGAPSRSRIRVPTSASDSFSDEDSDQNETEMMTARMLDAITASGGQEPALRAAQLMRGSAPGRKVASSKALASLESVEISDLPEEERTCIICYNDFGTETPEGINEAPLRLPKCQHVFGDHCIKKWFAESDSCPYCRDKLPSEIQRYPAPTETVFHLMRQHQIHVLRQHSMREASARDSNEDSGWAYHDGPSASSHRTQPNFRSWQPSERRSPPGDIGENRRRTRPRHGSLRGSPPSNRSNQYGVSNFTGLPSGQYQSNGNRFYPSSHTHRHSAGALGSPLAPRLPDVPSGYEQHGYEQHMPPYLGHAPMFHQQEPRLPFPNPLAANNMEPHAGWPAMRPETYPPVSDAIGGPEVRMADSDSSAGVHENAGASPRSR